MALNTTVVAAFAEASATDLTSKIWLADGMSEAASITAAEDAREAALTFFPQ